MYRSSDPGMSKILIVDDMPVNIRFLINAMAGLYEPIVANRGERALLLAEQEKPDLILLDIMMPDMDGYTVCQQLKEKESTRDIPIIFVTAMNAEADETKGLKMGAVDYVTKPFNIAIVLARIATHLALRRSYLQLEQQYGALQERDRLRKDVEAIARHDMKSPVDGIIGCSTLLLRNENMDRESVKRFHQMILDAARQLREMINLSLNLIKMEQGTYVAALEPLDLLPIIRRIFLDHQTMTEEKKVEVSLLVDGGSEQEKCSGQEKGQFIVLGDETLCYTMISNIFRNAVEASTEGQSVHVALKKEGMATISIHNQKAVPEEIRDRFFEKYVTSGKKSGTGLGTYSARLMAEAQKGRIQLLGSDSEGTTVCIVMRISVEE